MKLFSVEINLQVSDFHSVEAIESFFEGILKEKRIAGYENEQAEYTIIVEELV